MKVPTLTQPSVSTSGTMTSSPTLSRGQSGWEQAGAELQRGLNSLGRGVEAISDRAAKKRKEANAVLEANADLELNTFALQQLHGAPAAGGSEASPGFLSTQGLDAGKSSADALEALHAKREELAAGIKDEATRQQFLVKSAQRLIAYTGQVESHVSREFEVARSDSAKGLVAQQLASSEAGDDFWTHLVASKQVEEHLRALSPTAEGGTAAVDAFRAADAAAFVKGLLSRNEVDAAKTFIESNREVLGPKFDDAEHAVTKKLKEGKADREKAAVAGKVADLVDGARNEDGFVLEGDLRSQAEQLDPEDPLRDEFDAALERQARFERNKLEASSRQHKDSATLAALVDWRPIPAGDEDFLRKYSPGTLVAIREKQRAIIRSRKLEKDGTAAARAEARRAQAAADKVFLNELAEELVQHPETDPTDFEEKWIQERVAEGEDVTSPSEVASSQAGLNAAKAVKSSDKAETSERRNIARRLETSISKAMKAKSKKVDEKKLKERVGNAIQLYDKASAAKGKPLDEEEFNRFASDLWRDEVTEPGWRGTSIGQVRTPAVDIPARGNARVISIPKAPEATKKAVRMRFPNGSEADVPAEKLDKAKLKGGVPVE